MKICGIDEAGRGPVIGPMVMAGVVVEDDSALKNLGVKDSKLLSAEVREEMFDKVLESVHSHKYVVLSASEIDDALRSATLNLNLLEAKTSADILSFLRPSKVILDCPSHDSIGYSLSVKKGLDFDVEVVAEHKADMNYPVVSAASIIAKVVRDREIEKLKDKYGEIGSGYASDPVTQKFVVENWDKYPGLFRETWETWKESKRKSEQKGLFDF
jgi:ribonuclease HII